MEQTRMRLPKWFLKYSDYLKTVSQADFENKFLESSNQQVKKEEKQNSSFLEYKGEKPITSLENAIEFFQIDLEKWNVDRWLCNSWDVTMSEGKRTNYQVKVWLKRKHSIEALKNSLISDIKPLKCKEKPKSTTKDFSLEIDIFDFHLGKQGFNTDTLEFNWSLPEAKKILSDCIEHTLSQVDTNRISEFILPTGNDFFNINSPSNQTVRGTPQMTGEFFQRLFIYGHELITATALRLAEVAPVYIYLIPGNHDADAVFSLGEVLKARFTSIDSIKVNNTPILRKYHKFGKNLIGYAHGEKIKAASVHNAMSVDVPKLFAATKYRFFRLGHLHKNSRRKVFDLTTKDEFHGVDVEICPSLSPTDAWHYSNLYAGNMRRSKAFLYHREKGLRKEVYFNL